MKTVAYLRISTDKQDEASQRHIIAGKLVEGVQGVEWVSDTASGGTAWQQRAIAGVLERAARGDRIMVSEISRIARSTVGVLTFLQSAAEKGVTVDAEVGHSPGRFDKFENCCNGAGNGRRD